MLQVIKNPVTDHLPVGCQKLVMSFKAPQVVDPKTLILKDEPVVVVIGAMAHGSVSMKNVDHILGNY